MRHRPAFTLIELLVVIALIAILVSILLPALSSARDAAQTVRSLSAARSLSQSYMLYADDHAGLVLPAHVTPTMGASGVYDEFGNEVSPPVSQRWVYRLAPYFDHGWGGTTHVGARADQLKRQSEILADPSGSFQWSYEVSVFPSFGINRRYAGGDYRRTDWLGQGHHITRLADSLYPSNLIVFASARFFVGPTRVDGYVDIAPPRPGERFDESQPTSAPASAFGNVHPRYRGNAATSWLDGHADLTEAAELTDQRRWSDTAQRRGDPDWMP